METNIEKTTQGIAKKGDSKLLTMVQKNQLVVNELCTKYKYELMRCEKCPILKECNYTKKRIDTLRDAATIIAQEVYDEEVMLDKSAENIIRAQDKRNYIYNQYFKNQATTVVVNERCQFEKKEIISILEKFGNSGYDLGDPRVYIFLNDLLSNILTIGRMNKIFTQTGLLMSKESASGPSYYTNPLLKARNEISASITEAMSALDKMIKSDESDSASDDFASFLMKQLKLKTGKKPVDATFTEEDEKNKEINE